MKLRPLDVRFYVPDSARMIAAVRPMPDQYRGQLTSAMINDAATNLPGWGCYILGEQRTHRWKACAVLLPNLSLTQWDTIE